MFNSEEVNADRGTDPSSVQNLLSHISFDGGSSNSGNEGTNSFPSGTQILTPFGEVSIEDLKVGDRVFVI